METREKWDASAQDYQHTFRLGQNDYNKAIFDFWRRKGMFSPGCRVLDIGCGVGKYGVMFAAEGCDVTLTDISPVMLAHAEENLAGFSIPHRCFACDFNEVHGDEPAFRDGFDFSISTMSPAIHDAASIQRMSGMTRGFCFLTRFFSWSQPDRDMLMKKLGVEAQARFSGLKEDCDSLLGAIREAGYSPDVLVTDYNWHDERSIDEMCSYMRRNYSEAMENISDDALRAAVESMCTENVFFDRVYTKVVWIYWNTKETVI